MTDVRTCFLVGFGGAAFALAVRLATLTLRDVWIDEALTQYALSLDWQALVIDRVSAGHSPVYFLLLKAAGLDPANLMALRVVSAVLDSLACGVIGFAVARHIGRMAAAFSQVLYALHPILFIWAQNARPYALMMLMLALALLGGMEVIASRGQRRWSCGLLVAGLAGAAITLTGGLIAAILIALSPLGSRGLRSDIAFRRKWLWLMRLPAAVGIAMLAMVTLPHVIAQSSTYWTLKAVPFGAGSLVDLAQSYVIGDRLAWRDMAAIIGGPSTQLAILAAVLVLAASVVRGVRDLNGKAQFIPLFAMAFGLPVLLIAMSFYTSLLVPRYFLPAMAATTVLAGTGLAGWCRTRAGAVLAAIFLVAVALFAVNQSLAPGMAHNPVSTRMAAIILPLSDDRTQVLTMRGDYVGVDLRTEILPVSLGKDGHPKVQDADPAQAAQHLAQGSPVFLVATQDAWRLDYAPGLPAPNCLWQMRGSVLVYWGEAGCEKPSE